MNITHQEIDRARSALLSLDPGTDRDTWVRHAMGAKAAGLTFDDFHDWSAGAGNYKNEAECRSVWNSIQDGGITAASLFRAAFDAGWTDDTARHSATFQIERKTPEPSKAPLHDPLTLWNACKPAPFDHWYIEKKLGLPDGLRVYSGSLTIAGHACGGALVLPCYTLNGELASLQFVTTTGKPFLPGVKLPADGCLIVGAPVRDDRPLYICEGIGQAWSAHQATTAPAVVCFGIGRMASVTKALRERYGAAKLVLVADAGKESQMAAIARDIQGAWVEMPSGSPSNYDLNDLHKANGLQAVTEILKQAKEPAQRFRLLSPDDLANLPPARFRVRRVLPLDGIGSVFGPSGSGKSFWLIDLLAAIAAGRDWFGCRVKSAPVLYVALEGEAGISQRVKAWQVKHGRLPDGFRFLLQSLDIRKPADRADLIQAARAAGFSGGVLAIDTLNRAAPGMDENDSKSMGDVISATKAIQAELGGLVLLAHHTGKDAAKGMRGHSSLHAALDCALEITRTDDRREWKVAKSKDGEDGEVHPFRLDVVEVGTDEDGEAITSCVVVPEEKAADSVRRAALPGGGNMRLAYDAITAALKQSSHYGKAAAPITRPCVELDTAITAAASVLLCEEKRRRERAQLAITNLVSRKNLLHEGGWVWMP